MKEQLPNKVLFCDDNEMCHDIAACFLKNMGYETVIAGNGREAVDMIASQLENNPSDQFAMIFIDLIMPVMDGLSAVKIISEMKIDTPVIAITASIKSYQEEEYRDYGITDCISKPLTEEKLRECFEKYGIPVSPVVSLSDEL